MEKNMKIKALGGDTKNKGVAPNVTFDNKGKPMRMALIPGDKLPNLIGNQPFIRDVTKEMLA